MLPGEFRETSGKWSGGQKHYLSWKTNSKKNKNIEITCFCTVVLIVPLNSVHCLQVLLHFLSSSLYKGKVSCDPVTSLYSTVGGSLVGGCLEPIQCVSCWAGINAWCDNFTTGVVVGMCLSSTRLSFFFRFMSTTRRHVLSLSLITNCLLWGPDVWLCFWHDFFARTDHITLGSN